ncbi:hypothetical protein MNBD_ALPHA06-1010 [hydrothermal vent metagenome]|uniref:Uncharacterized protein n=1 Tax=hydrothermal vent metagenome TaxID=652676 RepID=A0A3B0RKK0_9ZZZZ
MVKTKIREQIWQEYVSPSWHGVAGWLVAYSFGNLVGIGYAFFKLLSGSNLDPQIMADQISYLLVSILLGVPYFAVTSLFVVWSIRKLKAPRFWADIAGGALLLGVPALVLFLNWNSITPTYLLVIFLGGACGGIYWLITKWLYRRGEAKWQKQVIDQF